MRKDKQDISDSPDQLAGALQQRRKPKRLELRDTKTSGREKPVEALLKPVQGKVVQAKPVQPVAPVAPPSNWLLEANKNIAIGYQSVPQDAVIVGYSQPALQFPGVEQHNVFGLCVRIFMTHAAQAIALESEPRPLPLDRLLVFPNIGKNAIVSAGYIQHTICVYYCDEFMSLIGTCYLTANSTLVVPSATRHVMETHAGARALEPSAPVWQFLKNKLCGAV